MKIFTTRIILLLFLTYFYTIPLNACAGERQEHSENKSDLSSLVRELGDLFLAGKLTVNVLEAKLSASATQAENKEYWSVDSIKYNVRSTVRADDKDSPATVLQLNTNELSQLKLIDLEKIFGDSRPLVPSKYPWVELAEKTNHEGKSVSIFAQLYSPPDIEFSPVLLLKLILE